MKENRPQFTVRTLLLFATLMGPLIGWYGPAVCNYIASKFGQETIVQGVPAPAASSKTKSRLSRYRLRVANPSLGPAPLTWQSISNTSENRTRWQPHPGVGESTERGMQADAWQRRVAD
ncbi:MAG: hypothetical protein AAF802_12665 [Planctomycetota bacterium]